jgi:hypothetical protein
VIRCIWPYIKNDSGAKRHSTDRAQNALPNVTCHGQDKRDFCDKKAVIWGCRYFWVWGRHLFLLLYRVFINSLIKFLWVLEGFVLQEFLYVQGH